MNSNEYPSYPDLKGRTVLVTGGGSGIGAAFVEAFVCQGSRVAFFDIQEEASRELKKNKPVERAVPKARNLSFGIAKAE